MDILIKAKLPDGKEVGSSGVQKILLQLACTPKADVFQDSWCKEARKLITEWLKGRCGDFDSTIPEVEPGQPFCLYLIHMLLREMRDADYEVFLTPFDMV